MRLWTLHPRYLDTRGLLALWREGLLAQAVLRGETRGYVSHPQLVRFRSSPNRVGAIADYLRAVHDEAVARGYSFTANKIDMAHGAGAIVVTSGQLEHEWEHLLRKLAVRDPERHVRLTREHHPEPHPLFTIVPGGIEGWERGVVRPAPIVAPNA